MLTKHSDQILPVAEPSFTHQDGASQTLRTHALMFDDPHTTLCAVRTLRERGFTVEDVYSPFPVHGLDEALGMPDTRLPWATFVGGVSGLSLAVLLQSYTHAVSWPLNIGGKSNLAGLAQGPVTFELMVLLAAFCTVGALFILAGLFPLGRKVRSPQLPDPRVSNDLFAVLVAEKSGAFDPKQFARVCDEIAPVSLVEGWRVR